MSLVHEVFFLISWLYFRSAEWSKIPEEEKKRVGLTFEEDGEFWYVLVKEN